MKQRTVFFLTIQRFVLFFYTFSQIAWSQTERKTINNESGKKDIQKVELSKKSEALDLDTDQVESQFLNSLDYPELQVVPRASERIQMDAQTEANNSYMMFWPFLASSGTTMIVALMSKNKFKSGKEEDETFRRDADFKVNAAAGLSAAWFGLIYFVSATEPYNGALQKINPIKGRDKKSLLLRERLAEEAMQKPAELIKTLAYVSTITNVIAAGGLMDVVSSDYNLYASVAILTAFLPLIFKNKYVENYEKQLEYKRKIFAPVVYTDLYKANAYTNLAPRLVLQWNY